MSLQIWKNKKAVIFFSSTLFLFFLGLILSLTIEKYRPYALAYAPFSAGIILLSIVFILLKKYLKDRKAKSYKWTFLTNLSCKLATKENRYAFYFSLLPLLGFLLFFARFYFYKETRQITVDGNSYSYKFYDFLTLQSYLVSDKLDSALAMNHVERSFSTIFNDWMVATTIGSLVSAFYLKERALPFRRYFLSFTSLLLTLFFPLVVYGIVGERTLDYRLFLMGIELAFLDFYSFSSYLEDEPLKINQKQGKLLIAFIVPFFFASMSCATPALLLGANIFNLPNPHSPSDLSHRLLVYLAFLLPVFYYLTIHSLSKRERRSVLIQLSLATFFGYITTSRYDIWTHFSSWPIHLCNTAMYTMPITLLFNTVGLYYFTFFINVLGAFLALLMPNFSSSLALFSPSVMHFYINHLYAFFMPVLIVLLKIYERPKMKYFLYSQIGFLVYFAFVMFVNVYLTAHGTSADFFFINSDFVAKKLGKWAQNLFALTVTFQIKGLTYEIHLLYDVIYYLVYILLAFGMWFVYELLFRVVDELLLLETAKANSEKQHHYYLRHQKGSQPMENNEISLKVSHLYKKYNGADNYAVEDFSMTLNGGKIYGFLGKNGAGKSTIIKSIVGIHGFDKGTIEVCSHNVVEEAMEAKMDIGFVPDNYALYENLTGRQYISYIADLYGVSKEDRIKREADLVKRTEMGPRYDKQMKTYSHGMKQKITIIAALIHEPKVWILDEPMTGLDPNSIYQIKECMKEHAKKGNIVFFSSHIIDVVKTLCDDVIIIKHGKLVKEINLDEHPEEREKLEKNFLLLTSDNMEETTRLLQEESKGQIL